MLRALQLSLIVLLSLAFSSDALCQRASKKNTGFRQQLWYGGSVGLGYQSFSSQSTFLFALFPMVGYKVSDAISIGPRLGASYRYIKTVGIDNRIYKFNPVEISGALFGRAKVLRRFFGHMEYEIANEKNPTTVNGSTQITNRTDTNFYLGAGYNSGGKIASEIYILYNFLEDDNTLEVPFVIRGGLTYNF